MYVHSTYIFYTNSRHNNYAIKKRFTSIAKLTEETHNSKTNVNIMFAAKDWLTFNKKHRIS